MARTLDDAPAPSMSSFAKVLTLSSTRSCGHGSLEYGGRGAATESIPTVGPLMVVELQKAIKRGLEHPAAGEVLPAKGDPPVLVHDRFLQAVDEPVRPRVSRFRPGQLSS